MKKHLFVYVFKLLMKNYGNMKKFLVRNLKTGTNRFNRGHRDSIPKTGTVQAKLGQLEGLFTEPKITNSKDKIINHSSIYLLFNLLQSQKGIS